MATEDLENKTKETILVIEDDKSLREGLAMNFELQGFKVIIAADGDEGMKKAFDTRPDLIVLDLMLPGWSGIDILEELREKNSDVPVLILSARDRTRDKIEGFEIGADDYVTKPFELPELLARVEAMLRRRRSEGPKERMICFGDVVIEPITRKVVVKGEQVELSAREFDLLLLLARSPGRPFTREVILDRVWGWGFEGTVRTVDNFIMSLRQSIEADPSHPKYIKTVRRVGYKLEM
ncbi:MAG: response regulator transcription factor [Proteobacteria bacterium]|nr:response regulator transcription factor [Pseudomonadota bacterium]